MIDPAIFLKLKQIDPNELAGLKGWNLDTIKTDPQNPDIVSIGSMLDDEFYPVVVIDTFQYSAEYRAEPLARAICALIKAATE